jgi:hypothetical protein
VTFRSGSPPPVGEQSEIAERFLRFAEVEARASSPIYETLARAVGNDRTSLAILTRLPPAKRQPNLLFGVMRLYEVAVDDPAVALRWLQEHEATVLLEMTKRRTQTNEVNRCATVLPALASIGPGPTALIEVGASAGLCLLFDEWAYHYLGVGIDHRVGTKGAELTLRCRVEGDVPLPLRVPEIAWRAGLDLNPLDPADPDVRHWLECLVWPEHRDRAETLRTALGAAAGLGGLRVDTGDALDRLPALLAEVPPETTAVVLHSATLAYLDPPERTAFVEVVRAAGARRLGFEAIQLLPALAEQAPAGTSPGWFGVSIDDELRALADGHGRSMRWL